jgi:hypothetical protein
MGPGATVARRSGHTLAGAPDECAKEVTSFASVVGCLTRWRNAAGAPPISTGPGSDQVVRAPERGGGFEILTGLEQAC